MLLSFIRKAIELGAGGLEIEYENGQEHVCAMRGSMGVGIGAVSSNSKESEQLFAEINALRKAKQVDVDGAVYSAKVSEYDSFGETAYRIQLTQAKAGRTSRQPR